MKTSEWAVRAFQMFVWPIDKPTNGPTDMTSYRSSRMHLKSPSQSLQLDLVYFFIAYNCLGQNLYFVQFLDASSHLYKRVCPSVRRSVGPSVCPSVRPSVRRSVTPVQKPRFSAVFGHGEILHWNKWSTSMFWEPPLLLNHFTRLFVHLSLRICHMINTRRDTVRTHLCPGGLVNWR